MKKCLSEMYQNELADPVHKVIPWECEELEIRKEKVPTKIKYPAFRDMPEKN